MIFNKSVLPVSKTKNELEEQLLEVPDSEPGFVVVVVVFHHCVHLMILH